MNAAIRAARGLVVGLALTALNFFGCLLTVIALGGLGEWSTGQFVGLFGLIEGSTGLAFVFGPNIWRLPVAEATTSDRTKIRLALDTIAAPHWAAAAKAFAGYALLVGAAVTEGVALATPLVAVVSLLIFATSIALSMIVARWGVARPGLDVVQFSIHRPGRDDRLLPAFSIGAVLMQFLLNILVFPTVKIAPPSILYQPEIAPSMETLAVLSAVAALSTGGALLAWRGRLSRHAPREQRLEQEAADEGEIKPVDEPGMTGAPQRKSAAR